MKWSELKGARVVDPCKPGARDGGETRGLLTLERFIARLPELEREEKREPTPWNIELKGEVERWQALGILDELFSKLRPELARRKIVLAAVWQKDADRIREAAPSGAYGFNCTLEEQLAYRASMRLNVLQSVATDVFA